MPTQLAPLINWFETSIVGSPLWSGLGLVAAALFGLFVLWTAFKLLARGIRSVSETLSSRKRRSTQGFGIAVAPIVGPGGGKQTKAVIAALQEHLGLLRLARPSKSSKHREFARAAQRACAPPPSVIWSGPQPTWSCGAPAPAASKHRPKLRYFLVLDRLRQPMPCISKASSPS